MEGRTEGASQVRPTSVVALWHDPGTPVPRELTEALQAKPGLETTRVVNPFMALAVLCKLARQADGGSQTALVIVHPEKMADAAAVCDAAAKFAPGAKRWLYGPAANPQLRAVVEADVEAWRGPAPEVKVTAVGKAAGKPIPPPPMAAPTAGTIGGGGSAGYRTRRPTGPAGGPALRLTGEGPVEPLEKEADVEGAELAGQEGSAPPSQLLSAEELRMLLGDDEPGAKA